MIIETDRLLLRPWEEGDAEALYKFASDPRIGPIAGWPVHSSVENSLEIIRGVLSQPETYAITVKGDGEPVGSIGLHRGESCSEQMQENEAELGYWIGVPFWGQGLTVEAGRALIERGFRELGYDAIWCGHYEGNEQSRRVQEKCGFIYHHSEKGRHCPLLNEYRDEHFSKLTREEWESSQ